MSILLQHSELVHMGPKSQFTWGRSMQSQPLREWKLGLRVVLHYGGEVHRSWILREFWNFIGWKWHSCLVVVCTMAKSPLVESFVHGWKKWHGCQRGDIFLKGGGLWKSSFLGNLKASNKKLGLRRTPTWIKYIFSLRHIFALFFALFSMTLLGSTKTGYIIEVLSSN